MAGLDALILLVFAAYALLAGWRARRQASRSLEEYFLAGRSLSGWRAGISMAATQFAADTPLLVTGLIAVGGIFSLWRLWIYALAFLLLGFVFAPCWRRAGVLTDAELSELRYGGRAAAWLRGVKAFYFGTVFNCTVLAMVLFAAVTLAEPFLLWDEWLPSGLFEPIVSLVRSLGVPFARDPTLEDVWVRSACNAISLGLLVGVTVVYSTSGGLRGVVSTDVVQFSVMILATAGYALFILSETGGMSGIAARLREAAPPGGEAISADEILAFTPSRAREAGWLLLAAFGLQWLVQMNADGTGYLAQRVMACRSDAEARKAAVVFTFAQILLRSLLWIPIGLGLLVLLPPDPALTGEALRADREASYVIGMTQLPVGLRGLMLTAMLAALASTLDSHLNWGASYWTHDLYDRFWCQSIRRRTPSPSSLVWVARLSTVLVLLVALAIMTQLSSIQAAWHVSLLLGAGMGVVLVLRWLWWRITAAGELAAIAASMLLAPILLVWVPPSQEALRLLLMAAGSTLAGVGVSLWGGPESQTRLAEFYRRVEPPGFWSPFEAEAGEGRGRLARELGATLLCAFTVFGLLTSIGSWWVGSAPPTWFPWRGLWLVGVFGISLALVPVWWRLGFAARTGESRSG